MQLRILGFAYFKPKSMRVGIAIIDWRIHCVNSG
jgi:hypothetical protein